MARSSTVLGLSVAALLLMGAGCQRGITEGVEVFRGGAGEYEALATPSTDLNEFDSIEVEEFEVDYDPTPSTLPGMLKPRLIQDLEDKDQPVGKKGDRTLVVRGRIIYYESSKRVDHVWGPLEEAVALVELVDKSRGKVIARAGCVGRSNASASTGVESKADGLAEAISSWIEKHRPTGEE
jgi:hypothetical protein